MPAYALFHTTDRLGVVRRIVRMKWCKKTGMPCWLLPTDSYWEGRPCSNSISSPGFAARSGSDKTRSRLKCPASANARSEELSAATGEIQSAQASAAIGALLLIRTTL